MYLKEKKTGGGGVKKLLPHLFHLACRNLPSSYLTAWEKLHLVLNSAATISPKPINSHQYSVSQKWTIECSPSRISCAKSISKPNNCQLDAYLIISKPDSVPAFPKNYCVFRPVQSPKQCFDLFD